MRTPKENKQKPRDRTLKSAAGTIPKAALKAAWIKTKEQSRTAARGNDTDPRQQEPTNLAGLAAEQSAAFVRHQGRKLAETQVRQHRQKTTRTHTAGEHNVSPKQTERGTLPDAEQRPRCGADLPRQRAKEKAVTAKTVPRDIRGVTQSQRQLRTAANETVRSITTQAQMQTLWRCARQYGIFLSACTVLSRPLLQGLAWHSVLLLSSALWPLCPARPMASFLPPMPPTPTQLPCNRQ